MLATVDVVVFMTDGIIEAQDRQEKMYSESGRLDTILSHFGVEMSAAQMVDALINDAVTFSGEEDERDDDMTVVVVRRV